MKPRNWLWFAVCMTGIFTFLANVSIAPLPAQQPTTTSQSAPAATEELFAKASNAVVRVEAYDQNKKVIGAGSGFFVSSDGLLVTNQHVVDKATVVVVTLPSNAILLTKEVVATDKELDLVILRFDANNLPFLTLSEETPKVGNQVYAIGNPEGLTNTLSDGLVSGIRKVDNTTIVQTTAPISQGSSGGPLLNSKGEVIGVNTSYLVKGQNLNFAVSSLHIKTLLGKKGPSQPLFATTSPSSNNDASDTKLAEAHRLFDSMTSMEKDSVGVLFARHLDREKNLWEPLEGVRGARVVVAIDGKSPISQQDLQQAVELEFRKAGVNVSSTDGEMGVFVVVLAVVRLPTNDGQLIGYFYYVEAEFMGRAISIGTSRVCAVALWSSTGRDGWLGARTNYTEDIKEAVINVTNEFLNDVLKANPKSAPGETPGEK